MTMHGIGTARSCKNAVEYMKIVAERGEWDRLLTQAFKDYRRKDYDAAFAKYAVMAAQGYEVAQHNAAWMLDNGMGWTSVPPSDRKKKTRAFAVGAASVMLYKSAAAQGNVDANLKIGDYYYYGKGGHVVDFPKATAHYSLASKRQNAQAMFNLGYMYEHGVGLAQDFYLAKRFYDKAKDAHSDAHVPVTLALFKLRTHVALQGLWRRWQELTGQVEPLEELQEDGQGQDSSSSAAEATSSGSGEPPAAATTATATATTPSSSGAEQASGSGSSRTALGMEFEWSFLRSDNFLIVVLALALGLVLFIRSERQLRVAHGGPHH